MPLPLGVEISTFWLGGEDLAVAKSVRYLDHIDQHGLYRAYVKQGVNHRIRSLQTQHLQQGAVMLRTATAMRESGLGQECVSKSCQNACIARSHALDNILPDANVVGEYLPLDPHWAIWPGHKAT